MYVRTYVQPSKTTKTHLYCQSLNTLLFYTKHSIAFEISVIFVSCCVDGGLGSGRNAQRAVGAQAKLRGQFFAFKH